MNLIVGCIWLMFISMNCSKSSIVPVHIMKMSSINLFQVWMCSIAWFINFVEPLSALLIINVELLICWFRACCSFLVRSSDLFCLCLCSCIMSNHTRCRNVSNVPSSVSLSGLYIG